jgi:peptide/nickel transport system substrate-binding protein
MLGRTTTLALGALCISALAQPAAAQKVLRVVPHAEPRVLDGYVSTAGITAMHMAAVYDTLFAWDEQMAAKPDAVGAWSVTPDQLRYSFTLRPGQRFHDGSPVTARDAVASVRRSLAKETLGRTLAPFVAAVDVVDDASFTMTMKEPFGFTLFSLSGVNQAAGIMREKEAASDPNAAVTEAIGSGPFRFNKDEWKPGSRVVYDRNPNYAPRSEPPSGFAGGKVVKVDRVEYTIIPDAATRYAALQRDEVDFLDQPSLDLIATVHKDPNIVMTRINPLGQFGVLRPNHLHPPFNHPKARQALAMMVDQREYAQAAFGEERFWKDETPCFAFWMCKTAFGTEAGSEPYRKQDLARARQLMQEAGYKGEKIVLIGASDLNNLKALTLVTAENLKKIGVDVELYMAEWGTVIGRRAKKDAPEQGGWHIFHTTNGGPSQTLPFGSLGTPTVCEAAWFGWPCDEPAEKLRQQFMRETDPAKQKQIAETLHRRLWEIIPYVPIANYEGPQVYRRNVTGVVKGTSIQVWWNIDKS